MSHTTKVNGIVIKSAKAIEAAVAALAKEGVDCELLRNTKPRAYYTDQVGMDKPADYCLRLNKSRYDVGFYAEGTGVNRRFEARCDFWGNDIQKQLGVAGYEGTEQADQAKLGRFYKQYTLAAATQHFVMKGKRVTSSQVPGTEQVQLVVS